MIQGSKLAHSLDSSGFNIDIQVGRCSGLKFDSQLRPCLRFYFENEIAMHFKKFFTKASGCQLSCVIYVGLVVRHHSDKSPMLRISETH